MQEKIDEMYIYICVCVYVYIVMFVFLRTKTKMAFTALKPPFISPWLVILFLVFAPSKAAARRLKEAERPAAASAIFIFGDSTADPGNNNFISTTFRSDFWPYGKDFVNHTATGRFSNGRLANDFIAEYLGIKDFVPPYLDPTLTIDDLMTGVSFASAGSGFDPITPTIGNVIPVLDQLEHMKEYKWKLEAAIGKEKTMGLLNNALFIVSAGTNDFVENYFTLPIRGAMYNLPSYTEFVQNKARQFLQGLMDVGARRIGVVGLPPMGCLPIIITLYSDHPIADRECVGNFTSIAQDFNQKLQNELSSMQQEVQATGTRIAYFDVYTPLSDMISGNKYGFEEVRSGCCGTGLVEMSFLCNSKSLLCEDASKYVFWDSIHPSQKCYEILAQALRPAIDNLMQN